MPEAPKVAEAGIEERCGKWHGILAEGGDPIPGVAGTPLLRQDGRLQARSWRVTW